MKRVVIAALLAPTLAAAGTFAPPPGCTGYVTVQAKNCKVSNHYRCASDPAGDQWRVDFGLNGAYFASRINGEAEWVQSINLATGAVQSLAADPVDPASFSELSRNGSDSFDFRLNQADGSVTRVRGFDTLTGRDVTIDGVALKETAFEFRETRADGSVVARARGNEYIHPDWRIFVSGPVMWDGGEGEVPLDHSPIEFVFPGEPGFFSDTPKYECDAVMSAAPEGVLRVRD